LPKVSNDLDFEEDYDELVEANQDKEELNEVMDNYKRILDGDI